LQLPTSEYAAVLHRLCAGLCATPLVRPRRNSPVHIQGLMPVSQRERILAAATRLFGEHGYQATSMAEIGAAAGVTGPNLYSYFGSKSDLLRVVVDRGTHALWLGLHAALRNGRSARGALEAVVRSYVELCLENNTLMSALIAEPALMADTTRASEREYVAEWVALVRAGHPPIRERHAAIRVHAALVLINNLARTSRTRTGAPPCEDLVAMAMAVLLAEDTSARMRSAV
jgi:AcrR family transcriptional regulator